MEKKVPLLNACLHCFRAGRCGSYAWQGENRQAGHKGVRHAVPSVHMIANKPDPINSKLFEFIEENWRTEGDSNPRYAYHVYTLSRRAPSTARPPVLLRFPLLRKLRIRDSSRLRGRPASGQRKGDDMCAPFFACRAARPRPAGPVPGRN